MGLKVGVSCNFLFKSDNTTERPIKAPSEWTTVFSKEHRALLFGLGDPDRHHLAANSTPGPQIKKKASGCWMKWYCSFSNYIFLVSMTWTVGDRQVWSQNMSMSEKAGNPRVSYGRQGLTCGKRPFPCCVIAVYKTYETFHGVTCCKCFLSARLFPSLKWVCLLVSFSFLVQCVGVFICSGCLIISRPRSINLRWPPVSRVNSVWCKNPSLSSFENHLFLSVKVLFFKMYF